MSEDTINRSLNGLKQAIWNHTQILYREPAEQLAGAIWDEVQKYIAAMGGVRFNEQSSAQAAEDKDDNLAPLSQSEIRLVDDEGAVQIILQYIDSSEGTEEELQYCARELLHKLLEHSATWEPVSGEPVAWVRDLDGTGSLHICAKGDPGAMGVAYVD